MISAQLTQCSTTQWNRPMRGCSPRSTVRRLTTPPRARVLVVRASKDEDERKKVKELEENLKKSGLDKQRAQQVLKVWQSAGGDGNEVTPEDLRKVLVKQGAKVSGLVVVQILLDIGAAYGAAAVGGGLGNAVGQYGVAAVVLQALAYFVSGYYAIGAVFDVVKLGLLISSITQFNVNSAAFLAAVKDLAGEAPAGLSTVDKAVEAVNSVKVVASLNRMAKLLKEQQQGTQAASSSDGDMLRDLATYLTLEKAQRLYDFDAEKYGINDAQAAEIATVFSAFDSDDNGVLSLDEFQRLCARYASDLSAAEVKAALELLDDNKDGKIQLGEFVEWWVSEVQPAKA